MNKRTRSKKRAKRDDIKLLRSDLQKDLNSRISDMARTADEDADYANDKRWDDFHAWELATSGSHPAHASVA